MVEIPFQIVFPWLMGTIVYWMCGLQPVASKYFILIGIIMLCSVCGFALVHITNDYLFKGNLFCICLSKSSNCFSCNTSSITAINVIQWYFC